MSETTVVPGAATTTFSRYDDVTAALADPALVPPPAAAPAPAAPGAPGGVPGTVAWLRSAVARFSS
ncbi:hypothetical protein ACFU6K_36260, partial [Kitasatospora sp. NPDC057512]